MLSKIRHYVKFDTLLCIYFAIFDSHLRYACQVWGQSRNVHLLKIASLQRKAVRIINFQPRHMDCDILFGTCNILKFFDLIQYNNCFFVWKQKHSLLPTVFDNYFVNRQGCGHNLRSVTNQNLTVPMKQTITYGVNSITYQSIKSWNSIPSHIKTDPLIANVKGSFIKTLFRYFLDQYLQ